MVGPLSNLHMCVYIRRKMWVKNSHLLAGCHYELISGCYVTDDDGVPRMLSTVLVFFVNSVADSLPDDFKYVSV